MQYEIISWYVVNCHVHLVAFPVPALLAVSQDIQQLQIQQKKTTAETTATTPKQTSITTTRTFTTIGVECEGEGTGEGIMVKAQEQETETETETEGVQISFSFCFSSQGFGSQCLSSYMGPNSKLNSFNRPNCFFLIGSLRHSTSIELENISHQSSNCYAKKQQNTLFFFFF